MSTPHHNRKRNVSRWLTATICGFVLAVSCAVVGCSSAQGESANTATDGFDRTQLSDRESTITQEPAQEQTTEAIAPTTNLGVVCIDPGHGNTADSTQTPIGPGSDETQAVEPGVPVECPPALRNTNATWRLRSSCKLNSRLAVLPW